jgi:hypothetical protein
MLDKTQEINFLQKALSNYSLTKKRGRAIFTCENKPSVVFLWGLKKTKPFPTETIWIVPDHLFYRKVFSSLSPVYFLKKEKPGFALYDRRKGVYRLPPVKIQLVPLRKTSYIEDLEADLFSEKKQTSIYCKDDYLDRLKDLPYLDFIRTKKASPAINTDSVYLWIKKILDKSPS